jgi:hypothetical protein
MKDGKKESEREKSESEPRVFSPPLSPLFLISVPFNVKPHTVDTESVNRAAERNRKTDREKEERRKRKDEISYR